MALTYGTGSDSSIGAQARTDFYYKKSANCSTRQAVLYAFG